MTSFVSTERQARSCILSDLPPIGVDGFSQQLNKLRYFGFQVSQPGDGDIPHLFEFLGGTLAGLFQLRNSIFEFSLQTPSRPRRQADINSLYHKTNLHSDFAPTIVATEV